MMKKSTVIQRLTEMGYSFDGCKSIIYLDGYAVGDFFNISGDVYYIKFYAVDVLLDLHNHDKKPENPRKAETLGYFERLGAKEKKEMAELLPKYRAELLPNITAKKSA